MPFEAGDDAPAPIGIVGLELQFETLVLVEGAAGELGPERPMQHPLHVLGGERIAHGRRNPDGHAPCSALRRHNSIFHVLLLGCTFCIKSRIT